MHHYIAFSFISGYLTDWTKDDTDEDDKFWKWMENDKENYNKKHPAKLERQGKKKKKIKGLRNLFLLH